MPVGVHSGTSQFTSVAEPELRPRWKKLAQLRKPALIVNQDALRSPQQSRERAGMLHAEGRLNVLVEDLRR